MRFQNVLTSLERHVKQSRTIFDRLGGQRFSIQQQFNRRRRRKDLDRLDTSSVLLLSAPDFPIRPANPDERAFAQKSLVQPIAVLGHPVRRGDSLAIEMRDGKSPGFGMEVIQIPYGSAGKVLPLQNNRDIAFVIQEGIFTGIIVTLGVKAVQTRIRICAVL